MTITHSASRPASRRLPSDSGFTLIELLVYISLMVVVLLIVGGMLINSLTAERNVRDATQASNAGQLVALSVGQGVRNASAIWKSGAAPEVLFVRTVGTQASEVWRCQAWSFQAGQIRTTTSSTVIPTDPASIATWTLLGEGVEQVPGVPIVPVFEVSGPSVTLNLDVQSGGAQSVRISTTSASRRLGTVLEDRGSCF